MKVIRVNNQIEGGKTAFALLKGALENGAKTLDDIKDETEAGTICGMCEDEIQEIIDELVK